MLLHAAALAGAALGLTGRATDVGGFLASSTANITVYHVNPRKYGGVPFNMDTGDVAGDLYFILRSVCVMEGPYY